MSDKKRKILFITTDQQRFDTLSVNGAVVGSTPVIDALAREGIRYTSARPQSVVCMPSRSTILTGQHPTTHGVWMNGVALPIDAKSVVSTLKDSGYRTALIGKAHFEPYLNLDEKFIENYIFNIGTTPPSGSHRGFEHLELATHGAIGRTHYSKWLIQNHPEAIPGFYTVLDESLNVSAKGGGENGAPQVAINPIDPDFYHTNWVAERTIDWLNSLQKEEDWFCWMSFPDPHHPWDPPQEAAKSINWRDVPLPKGYVEDKTKRESILDAKPRHWKMWYDGTLVSNFESPPKWVPATLTPDQLREVVALNAVECQLIDEAIGKVLKAIDDKGWHDEVDIIFTTDHGDLQGDFGLMFKGPYHVDALMRLPLIWRPAPMEHVQPAVIDEPVGLVNLAATFTKIAGIGTQEWMEGDPLPMNPVESQKFNDVLTEWDSYIFNVDVHLRTISTKDFVLTLYLPGTNHDGTEGELYSLTEDPLQQVNLWDDPSFKGLKSDLITQLKQRWPEPRKDKLDMVAPV